MNPQSPPPDMSTSYSWIGEDVRQAGIRGCIIHITTWNPKTESPVFWFQRERSASGELYVPLIDRLLTIGEVFLVIYEKDQDHPVKVINQRNQRRKLVDSGSLRDIIENHGAW